MTDYTDLKRRLVEAIISQAHEDRRITSGPLAERLIRERMDAVAAIAALEAEVARVSAIAHNAIDEWASWVHDQLDGTSGLAEAIAEVDAARAALADQPVTGSPR